MFGYEEGAFTGASKRGAPGKILQADGGTLFLDEIGDMPLALQSRLLRVLQERTVSPLGCARCVPVDFALICATNRNLRERVAQGEFREDLYYRINGLLVTLPPLRERTDLAVTVEKILRSERTARPRAVISGEVLAAFEQHPWPGNFRQLANVLRIACAMLDEHETVIELAHLPQDFFDDPITSTQPRVAPSNARLEDLALSAVSAALARYDNNVSAAARALGVSRNTLYRKMALLGVTNRSPRH